MRKYQNQYSNDHSMRRSSFVNTHQNEFQQSNYGIRHQTELKRVQSDHQLQEPLKYILEPGTPCEPLQEILATTRSVENGAIITRISKALNGPLLKLASRNPPQQIYTNNKIQLPKIPNPIGGNLQPHLPSYSATTHQGNYRSINEDKMTIVCQQQVKWFGIYDGHGGDKCAIYLKQHLHKQFFRNKYWKQDIKRALKQSFELVERNWLNSGDKSGSCCIVTLIYGDICYVANLGDSRAILVSQQAKKVYQITKDHKPSNFSEQNRILMAGGKIYQTIAISQIGNDIQQLMGPLRVYPGRLSTTRTFGDIQAKDPNHNGNPNVVISQPEITSFNISDHDFIIMGSDGIWDVIQNKQALRIVGDMDRQGMQHQQFCLKSSDLLLKQSILRGSTDNVSMVVIGLPKLYDFLNPKAIHEEKGNQNIKVLTAVHQNPNIQQVPKKKLKESLQNQNKENFPSKLKLIDNRINQISKNTEKLTTNNHR